MDIQVSSNFERLLFELNDRDGSRTAQQMAEFRSAGKLEVSRAQYAQWITPAFRAGRCDDQQTVAVMADVYRETGMLIDPHTAVGVAVARECSTPGVPTVTLATAHPAKFPDAVVKATGRHPILPDHLADLLERPEHSTSLPADLGIIQSFVRSVAR